MRVRSITWSSGVAFSMGSGADRRSSRSRRRGSLSSAPTRRLARGARTPRRSCAASELGLREAGRRERAAAPRVGGIMLIGRSRARRWPRSDARRRAASEMASTIRLVAGAAAEVAGDRVAHVVFGRTGRCRAAGRSADDEHPRRADPALRPAGLDEAPLQEARAPRRREPFDRHDLAPLALPDRHQARVHRHAVEEDRARCRTPLRRTLPSSR